jgi:hypothetical protein
MDTGNQTYVPYRTVAKVHSDIQNALYYGLFHIVAVFARVC